MAHQPTVKRFSRLWTWLPVLAALIGLWASGCGGGPKSGLDTQQEAQASRLDSIVKASGGEWSRVSPTDRDYLVRELAQGSETSAQMLFAAKAGKLARPRPGGPAASR